MKSYNKLKGRIAALLMLGCVGVFPGCDFLTEDVVENIPEEEWWQTFGELNSALNNIYRPVPTGLIRYDSQDASDTGAFWCFGNQRVEQEGMTDNAVECANYLDFSYFDSGAVPTTDESSVTYVWRAKWKAIRRACRFLENYGRALVPNSQMVHIPRMAAEARALRAYYHMELFMYYGEIPIVDVTVSPAKQNLTRAKREDIVAWITREFELAAEDLPVKDDPNYIASEPWRFTQGACHAWLSYLHLHEGNWEEARKWAKKVIDSEAYELFYTKKDKDAVAGGGKATESYSKLFLTQDNPDEANTEAIFIRNNGMSQARARLAPANKGGQTVLAPTGSLVNEYELADGRTLAELSENERDALIKNPKAMARDPRLAASIIFPNETHLGVTFTPWTEGSSTYLGIDNSSPTGYWVKKWSNQVTWDSSGDNGGKNHFYLMRYAVVLLNYVEAAVELDEITSEVYDYLDAIRQRAGMPKVDRVKYASQTKLRELVRRERRVELAFEGHRIMDIRRLKLKEVMNGPVYGAWEGRPEKPQGLIVVKTRIFNDRDYLWPIPATEIDTNPNMVQNPGY